jgi:hypothetical protein
MEIIEHIMRQSAVLKVKIITLRTAVEFSGRREKAHQSSGRRQAFTRPEYWNRSGGFSSTVEGVSHRRERYQEGFT